jgi:uncharacterized protein YprB with RNaseH-like and TPR domain
MEDMLRQRLETLNRGPLPAGADSEHVARASVVAEVTVSSVVQMPVQSRARQASSVRQLPGLVRRGEVVETACGEHLRVCLPLDELWEGGARLVAGRQGFLLQVLAKSRQAVEPGVVMRPDFATFVSALPERTLVLDLETCGLAGAALFLVGVLRHINGTPFVELLLARNYAEERAVLDSLWRLAAEHDVLVTFNGKTFDWPMVLDRSTRHRFDRSIMTRKLAHLDVLHHARRRWRRQLPDCRLLTLERMVCRRTRVGDVAGNRIPAIYADFVRSGFERDMDAVLYHNACDLVTLFDLALRLAA